MKRSRLIGTTGVAVAALVASALYLSHPALSSDHQDTYNLGTSVGHNTTADITDVYVFPSPSNSANVVLAMNTAPLTPAGMGLVDKYTFDPTLLYQFKISHDPMGQKEDQVIQFTASGTTAATQQISVYGPATPMEVGTQNTLVAKTATVPFNPTAAQEAVTINGQPAMVFAGPRADPFSFDLLAFFTFLGDRNFQAHTSQDDPPGPGTPFNGDNTGTAATIAPPYDTASTRAGAPSFNGFTSGTMSTTNATAGGAPYTPGLFGKYACSTGASSNTLNDFAGGFNVETLAIEVPKSLLISNGQATIHVWATTSSSTVQS